jgi:hypothetical protein
MLPKVQADNLTLFAFISDCQTVKEFDHMCTRIFLNRYLNYTLINNLFYESYYI